MAIDHKSDIDKLEKRVTTLREALSHLSTDGDWEEFSLIIRRPGYTTPAEYAFTLGIVESMITQTQSLSQQKGFLLKAAGTVGAR